MIWTNNDKSFYILSFFKFFKIFGNVLRENQMVGKNACESLSLKGFGIDRTSISFFVKSFLRIVGLEQRRLCLRESLSLSPLSLLLSPLNRSVLNRNRHQFLRAKINKQNYGRNKPNKNRNFTHN